jgi:hypothetical protein
MSPQTQKIYDIAKENIGNHMTLNPAIPAEEGCAEAVSKILSLAGVANIPTTGIPGTATLFEWLNTNTNFERLSAPTAGAIIVSATGSGNGTVSSHTGIVGILGHYYANDWGIILGSRLLRDTC